jgi:hypothetical protein
LMSRLALDIMLLQSPYVIGISMISIYSHYQENECVASVFGWECSSGAVEVYNWIVLALSISSDFWLCLLVHEAWHAEPWSRGLDDSLGYGPPNPLRWLGSNPRTRFSWPRLCLTWCWCRTACDQQSKKIEKILSLCLSLSLSLSSLSLS